ncbi:LOW QUALITY PROTEIN: ornithine decarboxylase-like [Uloborus diversus]|uniref:LOW QUALITY PROTEIN: ornithine decarboxylase-like n=1 Tax=Uloborus diversus TaxID=327109 RepID=UPI002408F2A6|nr:LOW QUALITY PROTEIN: ornithine decarboxylase-like [Uloborus diversus]
MSADLRDHPWYVRAEKRMSEVKSQAVNDAMKCFINKAGNDLPFYVADLSDVVFKYRYWRYKLPNVEPFYAVKCNSDPMLLRLMVSLGMHFDCASKGEIQAVLSAGAQPSDIIYAHPFKSNSFLRYAASENIDLMTFDCDQELVKIKRVFPQARLVIRIQIPDVPAGFPLSNKFGCELKHSEQLLQFAKRLGLNVVGVSFHVGSLCEQPSAFAKAIGMAREVFNTAKTLGFNFDLLDLGGGFPGASGTFDVFDKMCDYIHQGLEKHFPEGCGVRVIGEPGCYMVCSAYTLCTKVLGKKTIYEENDIEQNGSMCSKKIKKYCYYMNDGVYGSFAYGFEKYGFHILPLLTPKILSKRPIVHCKMWGATCCSSDCILEDCLLPEMEVGEYIAFDNMGAYTQSLTTTFNGFPAPPTQYIFPPQAKPKEHTLPPFEEFCRNLGPKQMKAFIKIQDYICHDDSNDDLFRKG